MFIFSIILHSRFRILLKIHVCVHIRVSVRFLYLTESKGPLVYSNTSHFLTLWGLFFALNEKNILQFIENKTFLMTI